MMSFTPMRFMRRAMEMPAAPAPEKTTLTSPRSRPVRRHALISAAHVTTAVPCWSSWKTGMSQVSLRRRSISKQRGAEMSSRFTPPKLPASSCTVRTISSTSLERMHSGKASTSAKVLKRAHLPSMTGMPASGPMLPRPRTAEPSVTTATRFQRRVYSYERLGSFWISRQGTATPGV